MEISLGCVTSVNDANDMAALLKRKQFSVIKITNANKKKMKRGITKFTRQLQQEGAVGLFFFAGHGMEVAGHNYLIPVGADIEGEGDVEFESIDAGRVMNGMKVSGNALNMIILDACRNNPFARSFRSASRGLKRIDPPEGSLMLYATEPGKTADDGKGHNGLFTQHLLKAIDQPNVSVEKAFKNTTNGVYKESAKKQRPWYSGSIAGDFYFSGQGVTKRPVNNSQNAEVLLWDSIEDQTNPAYFASYLQQYPKGIYAAIAKIKIQAAEQLKDIPQYEASKAYLTIKSSPESAKVRILNIGPKYKPSIELKLGRYHLEVTKAGYQRYTEWLTLAAEGKIHSVSLIANQQAQAVLAPTPAAPRRNEYEPEMADIPGGCYQMDSPSWEKDRNDNERSHEVCIERFQMGKKEVTIAEFK